MAVLPERSGPALADIGVFGGSGFYEFLDDAETHEADTPYGLPSGPITIGTLHGRRVAFLPRHGTSHQFPAHKVPYRANVHALWALGVKCIIGPCSVGSLQQSIHPGDFVVVDQLVDRTWGRHDTFHDEGPTHHQAFADPYDERLREALISAGRRLGYTVHDGGTMVVINGPRFSTRAESAWFRDMGWSVVNMTGHPETVLAAELGLPYASIALVTDYDAGVDGHAPVTGEMVLSVLGDNIERVRKLITAAIPALG
jgi:5'-methylthioadenosine phosphorylase